MTFEAKSDEVFLCVGAALRAILDVVELKAVLAPGPAQLALVIVAIENGLSRAGRYVSRIFPGNMSSQIADHRFRRA